MKEGHFRKVSTPGGSVRKSISFRRARLEALEEISREKGGLSLSGTVDDLLRLGIEAYREGQRSNRRSTEAAS